MKRLMSVFGIMWLYVSVNAQNITYPTLRITTNKTTTLIFPTAVKRGDIGAKEVLAQKVEENENLLFIKAAKSHFNETNLNVVTADGNFYTFTVVYDSVPQRTVYNITAGQAMNANEVLFSSQKVSPASVENYAEKLLKTKRTIYGISNVEWDVRAKVIGIYVHDDILFFQLLMDNISNINYDIDYIRFFITDNKILKRTASQQEELQPICKAGNQSVIKANSKSTLVFAFHKFTIPEAKSLIIQIGEKNGGRHLMLKVKNTKLIDALPLD